MSTVLHHGMPSSRDDDEQAMFNRQLATYRKIVAANLMQHHEVYTLLGEVLSQSMNRPFRFLDIACEYREMAQRAERDGGG